MKRFIVGLIMGFLLATAIGATASSNIRLVVNGREIETDVPLKLDSSWNPHKSLNKHRCINSSKLTTTKLNSVPLTYYQI